MDICVAPYFKIAPPSQLTVSADERQNNKPHGKWLGIKTTACAPSILSARCASNHGCYLTCKRASRTSLRSCKPGVANVGERWFASHTAPQAAAVVLSVQARQKGRQVLLCCQWHGPWCGARPTIGSQSGGRYAHCERLFHHACVSPQRRATKVRRARR